MIISLNCSDQLNQSLNAYTFLSLLGFVLCLFVTKKMYEESGLDKKGNFFLIILLIYPFFFLGSKLFSNFYYQDLSLNSFYEFIKGGMSLHGALLLSIPPVFLIRWIYQISPLKLGSILLTPLGIGIFLIRLGNTLNCELMGLASHGNDLVKILYLGKSLTPRFPIQILEGILFFLLSLIFIQFRKRLIDKNLSIKIFFVIFPLIRLFTDRYKVSPENMIHGSSFLKSDILNLIFILIALLIIYADKKLDPKRD